MLPIPRLHFFLLTSLWLGVHVFLFYYFGVRSNLYDARGYISSADFFLSHRHFEAFHQIFYAIPILLIALFELLPGNHLLHFILFQCLLSGFAALCLYRAAFIVFKDGVAALTSAIMFICWFDIIQWNTAVMTESIACSLICAVLLKLANFRNTLKDYVVLILLLIVCALARPTGLLVWLAVFIWLFARRWNALPSRGVLIVSALASFTIACALLGMFVFNYWDFTEQYSRGNIVTYMDTIEGERLYDASLRLDTSDLVLPEDDKPPFLKIAFFIWHNPVHFFKAAALKLFYLITGTRPYFSTWHNAYTIIWLSIVYAWYYFGFRHVNDRPIKYFSLAIIIANCLLVSFATVDWDNRFYVPMQPGIVLLAGGGGAYCFRRWRMRKNRNLNPVSTGRRA